MNGNESAAEEGEKGLAPPLLETVEDILHNRIKQKKVEMHKTQNRRADITERIWTEIEMICNGSWPKYLRCCDDHQLPRVNSTFWA